MITIEEILNRKEDQTFECKSIQVEPKALAIPLVAMANADGGDIVIGVSDNNRRLEGIEKHTERLNELLRVPFDYCQPSVPVSFTYLPFTDDDGNANKVLIINVPASGLLHTNQADEAYMRVGDKSRKLNFDERMQLLYDKGERYYEDTPVYGATIEDIDEKAVEAYMQIIGYSHKSYKEYLEENNGFIQRGKDGEDKISAACILLFGRNPQKFFPRARTRFVRYQGTDERVGTEMNVIKDVTFEGTILNQIRKITEYLETQIAEHTYLGQDGLFVTKRDYPQFVLQEMSVNSCCHRDYSIKGTEIQVKMFDDRLVFETPGRFPGLVKAENIRKTHFSRNPKIAQFLKAYNYVKEFGEGIDRIYRELAVNGLPGPKFIMNGFILSATITKYLETSNRVSVNCQGVPVNEPGVSVNGSKVLVNGSKVLVNGSKVLVNDSKVLVNDSRVSDKYEKVIAKASTIGDSLPEISKFIIRIMIENPYVTRPDLAKAVNVSVKTIGVHIAAMRGKYINRIGSDKNGFWEVIVD